MSEICKRKGKKISLNERILEEKVDKRSSVRGLALSFDVVRLLFTDQIFKNFERAL